MVKRNIHVHVHRVCARKMRSLFVCGASTFSNNFVMLKWSVNDIVFQFIYLNIGLLLNTCVFDRTSKCHLKMMLVQGLGYVRTRWYRTWLTCCFVWRWLKGTPLIKQHTLEMACYCLVSRAQWILHRLLHIYVFFPVGMATGKPNASVSETELSLKSDATYTVSMAIFLVYCLLCWS